MVKTTAASTTMMIMSVDDPKRIVFSYGGKWTQTFRSAEVRLNCNFKGTARELIPEPSVCEVKSLTVKPAINDES